MVKRWKETMDGDKMVLSSEREYKKKLMIIKTIYDESRLWDKIIMRLAMRLANFSQA